MHVKLPTAIFTVIGANGWPLVKDQVSGIRVINGNVEKFHSRGIPEFLIRDQLKHTWTPQSWWLDFSFSPNLSLGQSYIAITKYTKPHLIFGILAKVKLLDYC
jgi:hypothetical protein